MISIVNIGPHNQNDPMGERTYSVRINSEEIVRFRHKRADGLGACLLAASKAVEAEKWEKADKLLMELTADRKSNQGLTVAPQKERPRMDSQCTPAEVPLVGHTVEPAVAPTHNAESEAFDETM